MNSLPRALFISHGGGPMPLLGDPGRREMVAWEYQGQYTQCGGLPKVIGILSPDLPV